MIFDDVVHGLLDENADKREVISRLIDTLEEMDWDCQMDSAYVDHPMVRELFIEHGIIDPGDDE
jgi:hypothetical protein